jgi:hypothetical protein
MFVVFKKENRKIKKHVIITISFENLIKIWTRGQILAQKSTFSELPQNEREHSPYRHEPNATHFVSNGRREREISRFVRQVKQVKILMLTGQSVQSIRMMTWHVRMMMWHVHTLRWQMLTWQFLIG